jgi:hypothetical protein
MSVRLVFGSLGLLAALAFFAGGVALTWGLETQRDGSGYFTTSPHHYRTSSYALSSQTLDVGGITGALERHLARFRISATTTGPARTLFIGIARRKDVEAYLARVAHDELSNIEFDPFSIDYRRLGAGAPTAPPATQNFWRARATGTGTQTISWPIERGRWSAVVMNADASPGVSVDAQLAARVSHVWWIAIGLFVIGGLSLLGGGALVRAGVRTRRREPVA